MDDFEGVEDEPSVIVQLSTRVQDGTRCRSGSLDMCIQGKCQVKALSFSIKLKKIYNINKNSKRT